MRLILWDKVRLVKPMPMMADRLASRPKTWQSETPEADRRNAH